MHWTCDKCGKTLEISAEQLTETQGTVVCPQCLGTDVVPGYKRRRAASPPPATTQSSPPKREAGNGVPPPHRKRSASTQQRQTISFVNQPSPPSQQRPPAPNRTKSKKKKRKKSSRGGCLEPHSTLGCLWRSVLATLVVLALYSALGFLVQCT